MVEKTYEGSTCLDSDWLLNEEVYRLLVQLSGELIGSLQEGSGVLENLAEVDGDLEGPIIAD